MKKGATLWDNYNQHNQTPLFFATDELIEKLHIDELLEEGHEKIPGVVEEGTLADEVKKMNQRSTPNTITEKQRSLDLMMKSIKIGK